MEKEQVNNPIPFEQLALVGIDKAKLASLPEDVRKQLLGGEVTPLIRTAVNVGDNIVYIPAKLQIVEGHGGHPVLFAYPVRKELQTDLELPAAMQEDLKNGKVAVFGMRYLQMDPETKSVINKASLEVAVDSRIRDIEKIHDIELGTQQKESIRDGKPVELNVGGEKVTVGVDLQEPKMFKVIKGDMDEWNRQKQIRYDEAHPEFVGLVMTDKNRWEYQQVLFMNKGVKAESSIEQSPSIKR